MENNNKSCLYVIITFICIVIVAFIFINFLFNSANPNNPDGSKTLLERSATNNDIRVETNNDFSFSIRSTVTPNVDIHNLDLTFSFLDANNTVLDTKVRNIGNVSADVDYTVEFSLTEFSLTELFYIRKYSVTVTGGTVSYFAKTSPVVFQSVNYAEIHDSGVVDNISSPSSSKPSNNVVIPPIPWYFYAIVGGLIVLILFFGIRNRKG